MIKIQTYILFFAAIFKIFSAAMDKAGTTASQIEPSSSSSTSGKIEPNTDLHNDFYNTGRVGRRNAMPDILGQHCRTTTADLPDQLNALSTNDNSGAGTSASAAAEAAAAASSSSSSSVSVNISGTADGNR